MQPRRSKYVDPRLQSKIIIAFAVVAVCCVLLQAVSTVLNLHSLADRLPHDGPVVVLQMGRTTLISTGLTLLLLVPLSMAVATIMTHRIAGPLYRMRRFLEDVERGDRPGDCRIRTGDELQEFCALLNRATAPLRQPQGQDQEGAAETPVAEPRRRSA